jgi:hypothetical protein
MNDKVPAAGSSGDCLLCDYGRDSRVVSPERSPSESDGTLRSSSRASGLGAMQNVLYESTKGSQLLPFFQMLTTTFVS